MQKEPLQIQNHRIFKVVSGILLSREENLQVDEIERLLHKLMCEHGNLFTSEDVDINSIENQIVELIPTIKIEVICHKLGFDTDNTIVKTLVDIFFTEEKYFTPQTIKILLMELIKIQPEYLSGYNINIASMKENLNHLIEHDRPRLVQEESERERKRLSIVKRIKKNCEALADEWQQDVTDWEEKSQTPTGSDDKSHKKVSSIAEDANDPPEAELQETRTPSRPMPVPRIDFEKAEIIFTAMKKLGTSPNSPTSPIEGAPNSPTSSTNEAAKTQPSPRTINLWAQRIKKLHKSKRRKTQPSARSVGLFGSRPSRTRSLSTSAKKTRSTRPNSARGSSPRSKSRGRQPVRKRTNSTPSLDNKY